MLKKLAIAKQLPFSCTREVLQHATERGLPVNARSISMVELPVPAGREDEWNDWYHRVHIPEALSRSAGPKHGIRYRLIAGSDDVRYLAVYEFESEEILRADFDAPGHEPRRKEYERLWGPGSARAVRRRAFIPLFEYGDRARAMR